MTVFINARFLTQKISGVQRFAMELSKRLKTRLPGQVRFIAPSDIIHKELAQELEVEIWGKHSGHHWEQLELPKYLKKQQSPLLINLANTAPLFYPAQIVTIHDLAFKVHPEWFSKTFALYYNFLIPRISRKATKVITVSEYSKKDLIQYLNLNPEKIEVIYNGIPAISEITTENKYGNYILAVSSLDPRKNFKNLILAYNKLNQEETKLVVAGAANKAFADPEIQHLLQSNKNIVYTGYVSDEELAALYHYARIFVYPSLYEGFGLPPVEAMAYGCPVIVSNNTSLPEVCGKAGLYVDPENVADIEKAIKSLLNNSELRDQLIRQGKEQIQRFSWDQSAERLIQLIHETTG